LPEKSLSETDEEPVRTEIKERKKVSKRCQTRTILG
jgi:hypothetical protein